MTTNTAVPHLAERIQYAEEDIDWLKAGAPVGKEPWRQWQYKEGHDSGWYQLNVGPSWLFSTSYRKKPRTIKIGDCDVPEPVREALEIGKNILFRPLCMKIFIIK